MSAPDWQSFRSVFPAVNESTYLMTARRGPLSVPARRAIERILDEHTHRPGELVFVWRDHERVVGDKVARYLGASPKSIALTPSATAGLALAANGIVWKEGDEVVLPSIEFPANVYPWMQLERHGVKLRRIPPNALGVVTAAMLLEAITPRTRVVTASHVSFLNGYRIDVAALAAGCRKRGVLSVIDAAQTGGWMAIEFDALGCDVLVGLAQKYFCFPDGLGFFLIRPDAMNVIKPSAPGKMSVKHYNEFLDHRLDYSEDAWRFVSGSMATPQLYAFEAMVEFFASYGKEAIDRRCMELQAHLRKECTKAGLLCMGNDWSKAEQSTVVRIEYPYPDMAERLKRANVFASTLKDAVRPGFHAYNTEDDIAKLIAALRR